MKLPAAICGISKRKSAEADSPSPLDLRRIATPLIHGELQGIPVKANNIAKRFSETPSEELTWSHHLFLPHETVFHSAGAGTF
jgi:hypothetical protein